MNESRALLALAQQGDTEAFSRLAQTHESRLLRQALTLCGQLPAAEDLVVETLVEAWKSLRRYDGRCRFSTWLYAILVHRYQKFIRHMRSRPGSLSAFRPTEAEQHLDQMGQIPAGDPSPAEILAQMEAARQLRATIATLPDKHRQVVLLRFFEEASLEEIAVVCHCSIGTVKSRLHYALEKLRTQARLNR